MQLSIGGEATGDRKNEEEATDVHSDHSTRLEVADMFNHNE